MIPRLAAPVSRTLWQQLLDDDPHALPSQSPQWVDAMVATGGWEDATIAMETAPERTVVLPLVRRRLGGRWAPHSSFIEGWGVGGVLAPSGVRSADLSIVLAHIETLGAVRTTVRPNPLLAGVWAAAATDTTATPRPARAHVLDLSGGCDVVWEQRVTRRGRRDVRTAQRRGVVVRSDATGAFVPVFHDMLVRSFARWAGRSGEPAWLARYRGLRRDPEAKFVEMAARLGPLLRIYIAEVDDRPAASALVLLGTNAHYSRGALDPVVAGNSNAAALIQWTAISDAIAAGCRSYHMGETAAGAPLAAFKEKFGAVAHDYARYTVERLPLTTAERAVRQVVKRAVGFREPG